MTDIFISYAREDQDRVRDLVTVIEKDGWSVFWDARVRPGQKWRDHIIQALRNSRCVIVAWSRHSVNSPWVIEEASTGKSRDVLLPILLDAVEAPFGFSLIQAADLTSWRIGKPSQGLDLLMQELKDRLGDPRLPSAGDVSSDQKETRTYFGRLSGRTKRLTIASMAIIIIGCIVSYGLLRVEPSLAPDSVEAGAGKMVAPPRGGKSPQPPLAGEGGRPQPERGHPAVVVLDQAATAMPALIKLPGSVRVSFMMHAAIPVVVSVRYTLSDKSSAYFKGADGSVSKNFELPAVKINEVASKVVQDLQLTELIDSQTVLFTIDIEIKSGDQLIRDSCVVSILRG